MSIYKCKICGYVFDEDDIEVIEQDERGIMCAKAVVFDDENEDDTRGAVYMITRVS